MAAVGTLEEEARKRKERLRALMLELCEYGDKRLLEETSKVFKKDKEMKKGIAFPTCISVNNCICHFSPLKSDPDTKLQDGDMVKMLFDDEKKAKMGVVECVKHDLMQPFHVLFEREGEFVAQFKATVILMPNGPLKITGLPFDVDLFQTEHKVEDEEVKALLASSASRKAAKKKKKKAGKSLAENADAAEDED
nr:hypothetical protein BaRGS_011830 [Batillaria attramentaria]